MFIPNQNWLKQIHHFKELSSTMDKALQLALAHKPEGTTVVAETQQTGRGRQGRRWFSPPKAGLWMTTILRPQTPANQLPALGLVAGASVLSALHELEIHGAQLKWPNDIMVGERKLAGILLEAHQLNSPNPIILIGIGLNLIPHSRLDLPPNIIEKYIGLAQLTERSVPTLHGQCLPLLSNSLEKHYLRWANDGLQPTIEFWLRHNWLQNHWVQAEYRGETIQGRFHAINSNGELELSSNENSITIRSGEIERIRPIPPPE